MTSHPARSPSPIIPIILAGGVGARLWPLSREMHPKPFIKINDGRSLIQKTYLRAASLPNVTRILTITNRELFFYTKDEYADVCENGIFLEFILEPFGRDSATAIALAAHDLARAYGPDAVMLILPSDHLITKHDAFSAAVQDAVTLALDDKIVTFGVTPERPETGYGYIETQGTSVRRFIEKPDASTARSFLHAGNYLWNAGMLCMRAGRALDSLNTHCPLISQNAEKCLSNAKKAHGEGWRQQEIRPEDFQSVQGVSFDYAVLEKSDAVAVVRCDIGWTDVGSFLEFGATLPVDSEGNHTAGETILEDVANCVIHGENRMIAGLGVKDLLIIDTNDALLVANRARAQDVRKIVERLKKNAHESYRLFPSVHRPWGSYTVLQQGVGFKIKRIEVKPGASLSLQSHKHRSEHWVVVTGDATIVNGDACLRLSPNESTYVPTGCVHRLSNLDERLLILIEIQCGAILSEEDIVRYDDVYGRASPYEEK